MRRVSRRPMLQKAAILALLVVVLPAGCARSERPRRSALATGYDPAWSPDGSRIAYVEAAYRWRDSRGREGIWLDNGEDRPTPRDTICIWNLGTDARQVLQPARSTGRFISSLVWKNNDELAFLAADLERLGRRDPDDNWHWVTMYRYQARPQSLFTYNLSTDESALVPMLFAAPPVELEPGRGGSGEVTIWEYSRPGDGSPTYSRSWEMMSSAGQVVRRADLPPVRWNAIAAATVRTLAPVGVRAKEKGTSCLSRIGDDHYQDFYSPGRMIIGVYGSPDGKRLAFCEEVPDHVPGARMSLKVIAVSGGLPVVVANDAWPWSHVAWSPDGRRIAYVRADDGRIAIARVPPLLEQKTAPH